MVVQIPHCTQCVWVPETLEWRSRKGDRARARKEIETSLSEHPSQDDAAKIREFLASLG